ncbi:MAG: NAD(P)H-binding protein [Deltaproteobacteria bacterium]|nr:NAD(P)H-binding protein [Deltaproteobacteria bacterium]
MKIILFGATGMIGQGVLKVALEDPGVERVLAVVRSPLDEQHPRLLALEHKDFKDYTALAGELVGYDACLFCLGVSAGGMSEAEYTAVTYDVTVAAAKAVLAASPGARFLYVSGAGTDSSERGRAMWARVKGRTENTLLALPFKGVHMLRPGIIQPTDGIVSKTPAYRYAYAAMGWLLPLAKALAPRHIITTRELARAMLAVARGGSALKVLEAPDLIALGRSA